jgi:hypothetical protein
VFVALRCIFVPYIHPRALVNANPLLDVLSIRLEGPAHASGLGMLDDT